MYLKIALEYVLNQVDMVKRSVQTGGVKWTSMDTGGICILQMVLEIVTDKVSTAATQFVQTTKIQVDAILMTVAYPMNVAKSMGHSMVTV